MATFTFARIADQTEKAIKLILREGGYDLVKFKEVKEKFVWVPKSVLSIEGHTATVADWFYNKNIAVDTLGSFMKSLSNA